MPSIAPISEADRAVAVATIVTAFAVDPVERRTAWAVGDSEAVAFWLEPGVQSDEEAVVWVLAETVSPAKQDDLFATLEQMAAVHPTEPHWYLSWLAVSPADQGRGLGGLLLDHGLATVDSTALPAFLETPNPAPFPPTNATASKSSPSPSPAPALR